MKSIAAGNKYLILIPVMLLLILSCRDSRDMSTQNEKLQVIATIFPLYDLARNIGGNKIAVTMLLPPATDAHNYELKPDDIIRISKADLFLYVNMEMEHWAYKVIKTTSTNSKLLPVETGGGIALLPVSAEKDDDDDNHHHDHEHSASKFDPHIWLDFGNAQKMADNIAAALIKIDSKNSDYYLKNTAEYKNKLADLDGKFQKELAGCKNRSILHAGHWAFAYMANRYGLKYYSVYNVSANSEPEPQKIIALIKQIKKSKASHIFYEDLINPRLAETIAQETGAGLLKLNNGHTLSRQEFSRDVSFFNLMEENLSNLKKGMQCR